LHPLSQVIMFIYSSLEKWFFPLSCVVFLPLPLLQVFLLLVSGQCHLSCLLQPASLFTASLFIYSSCGKWGFPLFSGAFLPLPVPQASLLLATRWVPLLLPCPASLFVHSCMRGCPSPPLWHSGHPTLFAAYLFCCYCLLFSFFLLSLGGGWSVQGGYADLAQGCL
jgi:hypothetical protein